MNNYLILKVSGKYIYKFINKCKYNNINLLSINIINNKSLIIKIYNNDYKKLLKIKGIYKINIINKKGLIKIKELIYNYKYLVISFIIGLIILIVLSNTIFNINIISSNNKLNSKIKKELEFYNIKKYSLMKSYNEIDMIKKKILKKYKNSIEWIEIDRNGTSYNVQIVERKIKNKKTSEKGSNIIAKKSGVIKKIFVINGSKVLNENDYVNKGDIIISGIIKKDEEVKGLVNSNGYAYAETWYKVKIEYPLNYKEEKYTNKSKKTLYLKIGNKIYEKKRFERYNREKIINYTNSIVPIEIGIINQKEKIEINDKLSLNEAKNKAKEKAINMVKNKLNKDEYIISEKPLNFYQKNSKIVLEEFFSCYENIGIKEEIE